jgi:phosphoadenosine phosphosulfate reductase
MDPLPEAAGDDKIMIDQALIAELEKITEPGPLMAELERRFPKRTAIGTSGQLTGCALIDMAVQAKIRPRVFTIDTLRLFPETYELFDALEQRYKIHIERFTPSQKDLDPMIREHGEYLFFDSKEKQERCCNVRKVLPNEKALDTVDVWITGLRADQSQMRSNVSRFQIIQHTDIGGLRPILKVAPLAGWTEQKVREYLKANRVPVHELLEAKLAGGYYYESVGCVICTTPIGPHEPRRAGRWRWFNSQSDNKECGIHLPTPDKP